MGGGDDRFARLAEVGGALRDAALARLRRAAGECRRLEAELAALDAEKRRAEATADATARAFLGDSPERWYRERRTALNAALARARVEEAMLMKEAAVAFGRDDALRRLRERSRPG
ncbi:hypothetical protein SAMN05444722_2731 [Rhodovulum sp. ES.010]|uniref:hypothetical protein n=1 Tax=Rhodovulum sp. ES.010 TaxID=1882821 RepID=UPI00092C2512|nr:hypothetical protein [Rhodovulum sp. ES.010]SIO49838.1 hypothetical protein SAMN05444722_2731 [Rhodovulum sp. ES.010]